MGDTIEQKFDFACAIAREAGMLAKRYFSDLASLTVQSKGVQDMATEADINTENLIRSAVNAHYPGDGFLGEESCREFRLDATRGTWVVDPIDGTQPFVSGIPSWCVIVAYVENNTTEIGVIYDPVHDELFAARRGAGATLNGEPIDTAAARNLGDGLTGIGYSNRVAAEDTLGPLSRLMASDGMFHRCGSGGLTLAYVACGRLIGYFEPHMNAWDSLAGILLVCEAGGAARPFLTSENSLLAGNMVIASGRHVFEELAATVEG